MFFPYSPKICFAFIFADLSPPVHFDSEEEQFPRTVSEGMSSAETCTPPKSGKGLHMVEYSPTTDGMSLQQNGQRNEPDVVCSDNNSTINISARATERQKNGKNRNKSLVMESTNAVKTGQQSKSQIASAYLTEVSGDSRDSLNAIRVKSLRRERHGYLHYKRNTKSEILSDSGMCSPVYSSETSIGERKRKADINEKESLASTDSVRKSKHSKSNSVVLESHHPISNHLTTIQTSLPQGSSASPQNLNVKIDLSLYNISGQLITQSSPVAVGKAKTEGSGPLMKQVASSQTSAASAVIKATEIPKSSALQTERMSRNSRTKSPLHSSTIEKPVSNPKTQSKESPQKRQVELSRRKSSMSFGNRVFPNSWCDDSDSDTDHTWEPGSEKSDTDDTLTEEEEILSDSSYELIVPKSAADLLDEYKSDDTDESWTPD